ncbi:MAG: hypothetical protein IPM47_17300 [Sphingobacteriales bacterium]|nr:MAG: hypothetical protein IPM47_17300 [Sphingobacteriales bacterium]
MSMNFRLILLMLCLGFLHFNLLEAQPPTDGSQEIAPENVDIVKPYEPVLADAVKIDFGPDLPTKEELEKSKPVFSDYFVPNRYLTLGYDPLPLKPMAYKTQTKGAKDLEDLHNIWLQAGYGNLNTPFIEASVSSGRSKKLVAGATGSHISSQGRKDLQDYAQSGVGAYGKYFTKSNFFGLDIGYKRQKNYYYGFHADTLLMPPPSDADAAKQLFQTISGSVEFGNSTENKSITDYNLKTTYHWFGDHYDAKENNVIVSGTINRLFNENIGAGITLHTHYSNYKDSISVNNLMLNVIPSFTYRAFWGTIHLGANAMLDHKKFYPYPYINASAFAIPDKLEIYLIWKKELVKTNYMSLTAANPFVEQIQDYKNARREERNLGVKGNAGIFSFDVKGGQDITANQPFFVNDSTDLRTFDVVYDKLTTWFGAAEAGVTLKQGSVGLAARYNSFKTDTIAEAWHLFPLDIMVNATYSPLEKLTLQSNLFVLNRAKGRLANGDAENLKGILDLNFSARYNFTKNIGVFANVNNILSVKAERFLYYPGYGLNALGGILLKF